MFPATMLSALLLGAGDGLTIEWKSNFLIIAADDLPGGPIRINYLEAYCRSGSTHQSWQKTVIGHRTQLLSADRKHIRLRCKVGETVTVDHDIVAGDDEVTIHLTATNSGTQFADVQWAQPCMRVDRFTGLAQDDYFRRAFIVTDRGPTLLHETRRTDKALYTPGQVYVPAGVDRNDVNPRPLSPDVPRLNLIGAFSADNSKIMAMAWDQTQELFQGVVVCVHADFRIGGLKPGETKKLLGKVYVVPNDMDKLLVRYRKDFNGDRKSKSNAADDWSRQVTIHRDEWGTPHIEGPTDAACVFGFAYAQCEDFFWQVEDTYIQALGRYAEVAGESGLRSDLINRAFEVVPKSKRDYPRIEPEVRELCEAFTAGLNHYLAKHPEVKPRMIARFEPWHVLAYSRQLNLTLDMIHGHVPELRIPRVDGPTTPIRTSQAEWSSEAIRHIGSNAWALGPSRTRSKRPILLTNPHQPWFGYGQFYEAHLKSGEGWNFTGACFFGFPLPSIGHNEHLGWAFTFNEPNMMEEIPIGLKSPTDLPDLQNTGDFGPTGRWREPIRIARLSGFESRIYEFRKVQGIPILHTNFESGKRNSSLSWGLRIPKFDELCFLRQARRMIRARNIDEFRSAMALLEMPLFNTVYADRHGNIYYLYNAIIPRRKGNGLPVSPNQKLDILRLDELPQILNPQCGYLQSCNASPFRTCEDADNPSVGDYPHWFSSNDRFDDKRRCKMSRMILRNTTDATRDDIERKAFDTTSYWALSELPRYRQLLKSIERTDPRLAASARPYLQHLLEWDCKGTPAGTQMTLCVAWYDILYGRGYPVETLLEKFQNDPKLRLQALIEAASGLEKLYGTWKVRWSDVYRMQRHPNIADLYKLPFNDKLPSYVSNGVPGPLGVIFTQYYSPQVEIPFLVSLKKRYGVVGTTYLSVVEFSDPPRGRSLLQFGASGDPNSPHFMDQARLLSDKRLKPQWFEWSEVLQHARRSYHPGD